MYLKTRHVVTKGGTQKIDRGIHRGLVKMIRIRTQKASPSSIKRALDCKKISS